VKKTAWLVFLPGVVAATLAVVLMVAMEASDPEWLCSCDAGDWHYVGPNGVEGGRDHLDATGHATSCKRTDGAAKIMDRVFDAIFPDQELKASAPGR